ncbi:hypothetical protein DSM3645_29856 [Blastopirellula marina DSM 3645]|uniref:Helix-turn-helix domain-containing protein n=1 Tax=Blastopirellula marina DSM 3645 TaxID=314230 RepID=A3ZXD7_9BACT|nr:hypothetical protein DSM3645_29856 [Blastopirellula marina DSM 3645]
MHERNQVDSAPILVGPKEAARLLSVSPRKLWAMTFADEPALPHVKMGRLVRYPVTGLQAHIEAMLKGGQNENR